MRFSKFSEIFQKFLFESFPNLDNLKKFSNGHIRVQKIKSNQLLKKIIRINREIWGKIEAKISKFETFEFLFIRAQQTRRSQLMKKFSKAKKKWPKSNGRGENSEDPEIEATLLERFFSKFRTYKQTQWGRFGVYREVLRLLIPYSTQYMI